MIPCSRVLVWTTLAGAAWCQPEELTLQQAVQLALKNNRQVRMAALEVGKTGDELAASRTYRLPQFRVDVLESQLFTRLDFTFSRGVFGVYPPVGPIPDRDAPVRTPRRPNTLILARATQPLSQLYRINLGVKLRDLGRQAAEERARLARQSVVHQVEKAYYGIQQTESALRAAEEAIQLYRELDRVAAESLAQQAVLQSESLEVKARLAKAEYDAFTVRQALASQKESLNVLLGRDPRIEFRVTAAGPPAPEAPPDLEAARVAALAERPELKEARLRVRQAEYDRAVKKSEFLPDVSLMVNYLSPFSIEVLPKNLAAGGLLLSWDVFDWGRKKRELAARDKTIEQAKQSLAEAEAQVLAEVGARRRRLEEARTLIRVVEMARVAAEERLRVAKNRHAEQAALLKDVLESQTVLSDVERQYQQAVAGYLAARSEFEKAVGR